MAVLVGDFLFAQSSWGLAQLDNLEVIKLISQVIADFADGEISQAQSLVSTAGDALCSPLTPAHRSWLSPPPSPLLSLHRILLSPHP